MEAIHKILNLFGGVGDPPDTNRRQFVSEKKIPNKIPSLNNPQTLDPVGGPEGKWGI